MGATCTDNQHGPTHHFGFGWGRFWAQFSSYEALVTRPRLHPTWAMAPAAEWAHEGPSAVPSRASASRGQAPGDLRGSGPERPSLVRRRAETFALSTSANYQRPGTAWASPHDRLWAMSVGLIPPKLSVFVRSGDSASPGLFRPFPSTCL